MTSTHETHEVTNQPPALDGFDPLACDPALADALRRHAAGAALTELAREAGSAAAREHGRLAELH
ncbi:MAG: DNA alkylation response protein, partial [Pseudonocardiaceae bacterium]